MRRGVATVATLVALSIGGGLALAPVRVLAQSTPPPAGSASASASAPSAEDKREKSKEFFLHGVELMQNGAYDAALADFMASIALYSTKNARKNAAMCLRELGRNDEALVMYQQLLTEFGPSMPPADVETTKQSIAVLEGLTGYVAIQCNVTGATVVVDGRDRGKTPLAAPVLVSAGTRIVRVAKEGYTPFEAKPIVAGKQVVDVVAELHALSASGRLRVAEASGKSVDVLIDGAVVGKSPWEGAIAPGTHSVLLRGEGNFGTQPAAAVVKVNDTVMLTLAVEELPGEARIETEPGHASVMIDGVLVGQGTWQGRLRIGMHKVDVSADGFFATNKPLDVLRDKTTHLKVKLERDEYSPFWSKGRVRPIGVSLYGGGLLFGGSLGGNMESSCSQSGVDCYARNRPLGVSFGARGSYDVGRGLSFEIDVGYAYLQSTVSRRMKLEGENGNLFPVDIEDSIAINGVTVGAGASFSFIKKPISISAAVTGGAMLFAKVRDTRNGTVQTDQLPSPRALRQGAFSVTRNIPWIAPEIRIAVPLGETFHLGLGLGIFVAAVGDGRPKSGETPLVQTAQQSANDADGNPTYNGVSFGILPQGRSSGETAAGTFVLPRATLFVKASF